MTDAAIQDRATGAIMGALLGMPWALGLTGTMTWTSFTVTTATGSRLILTPSQAIP